eukprot:11015200-Prorocentrum_lima.AAC.1
MTSSLVGSEMCIRDRRQEKQERGEDTRTTSTELEEGMEQPWQAGWQKDCLLYTSDAADDM